MVKIPNVNLSQVMLVILLLYVAVTIIIKELPLILFAVLGLLAYWYREQIKKKLKEFLKKDIYI